MKKTFVVLLVGFALLMIPVLAIYFIGNGIAVIYDNPNDYKESVKKFDGERLLLLFPDQLDAEKVNYYHYKREALFDTFYQINLEQSFTEKELTEEIERLNSLNENYKSVMIRHEEELTFYQFLTNKKHVYHYAVLDQKNSSVHYIYLQYMSDKDIKFEEKYLIPNFRGF